MKYSELVEVYEKIEATTKRLEQTHIISNFLKQASLEDLGNVILLLEGRVFPRQDERETGIASKIMLKAINLASGETIKKISHEWKKTGDLGTVSFNLIKKKTQATLGFQELTVSKVLKNLRQLSTIEGIGSIDKKIQLIAELLTSAKPNEAKYIARTILNDMRIGVGEGTIRDSIAWAFFPKIEYIHSRCEFCGIITPRSTFKECLNCKRPFSKTKIDSLTTDEYFETPEEFIHELRNGNLNSNKIYKIEKNEREAYNFIVNVIQKAYDLKNDFVPVAEIAKKSGLEGLEKVEMDIGSPIKVMLALKVEDIEEGFERCGKPAEFEFKYDGMRMQIHKNGKEIKIFTRRLENVTNQFPEVVENVEKYVNEKKAILDSEAVGYDKKSGKYLPFQSISQRIRRKYDIKKLSGQYPVEVNVFDIINCQGKSVIGLPFQERKEILKKIIKSEPKKIILAKSITTSDEKEVHKFYSEALDSGNEGLMIKKLDAPYKPGARVGFMCKLKPTKENLDLVIVKAEWGEGKRSSWLSSYTLACIDEKGNFLEVGKAGTGLKEKEEEGLSFSEMTSLLKPLIKKEEDREVILTPKIVIEVGYEELQKSPTYNSGFALRFPKIIQLRQDRNPSDITALSMIEDFFDEQKK